MTDTASVTVAPSTAPGPGGRMQRTVGQIAGSTILLELWFAFGWFGSEDWTERQVLAVTGTTYFLTAAGHNLVNWFKTRDQPVPPPAAVEVSAVAAEVPKPKRTRGQSGQAPIWFVLLGAVVAVLLLALAGRLAL